MTVAGLEHGGEQSRGGDPEDADSESTSKLGWVARRNSDSALTGAAHSPTSTQRCPGGGKAT